MGNRPYFMYEFKKKNTEHLRIKYKYLKIEELKNCHDYENSLFVIFCYSYTANFPVHLL